MSDSPNEQKQHFEVVLVRETANEFSAQLEDFTRVAIMATNPTEACKDPAVETALDGKAGKLKIVQAVPAGQDSSWEIQARVRAGTSARTLNW